MTTEIITGLILVAFVAGVFFYAKKRRNKVDTSDGSNRPRPDRPSYHDRIEP